MQIIYFLISLCLGVLLLLLFGYLYDKIAKLFETKPIQHISKPQSKTASTGVDIAVKKAIKLRFAIETNGSSVAKELNDSNFKVLLSQYFIATDYLFELWLQYPFHLTINDDLHSHYGRPKDCLGFIKSGEISEIFVLTGVSQKQKTGILLHEIAHDRAYREARINKRKIQAHGKEFKRHLNKLFAPLVVNDEHFSKHKDIGKHLRYEARKYSPPLYLCE